MIKVLREVECGIRSHDPLGAGHYGATRGSRLHRGIDLVAEKGDVLLSPVSGTITKIGFCYSDDLSYRYIQVTEKQGGTITLHHRFFYVEPICKYRTIGSTVLCGDKIGLVQEIVKRYPNITPHFHYEIKDKDGQYLDPTPHVI